MRVGCVLKISKRYSDFANSYRYSCDCYSLCYYPRVLIRQNTSVLQIQTAVLSPRIGLGLVFPSYKV